jgi:ABC-type glycerol-3-phosphate transport system substrate-binding protein
MQGTDAIAICSGSKHKDAAWKFIESFLLEHNDRYSWNFPTTKSELKALMDEAMVMDYMYDENGEIMYDENGEPMQYNKGGYGWGNSDDIYYIYAATQKQVDDMMELINSTTTLVSNDTQLLAIIQEEAAHFFAGKKSAKECADIIQGRIQTYVDETR